MPSFRYRAVNSSGDVLTGRMEAVNENELAKNLSSLRQELISSQVEAPFLPKKLFSLSFPQLETKALCCAQIANLLQAGVPLLMTLEEVAKAMPQGFLSNALHDIERRVANGTNLTEAFRLTPSLCDPIFLALLHTGEASGDLEKTFLRLESHLRWQAHIQKQMRRALRYPLFLLFITGSAMTFMLVGVLPQILEFLETMGGKLPLPTNLLIGFSVFFSTLGPSLLSGIVIAGLFILFLQRHSSRFSLLFDVFLLKLPFFGLALRQLAVARFAESLYLLLQNGLHLPEALSLAVETLNNRALREEARHIEQRILSGTLLSEASQKLFPPLVIQILKIGEQSGHLEKALQNVTSYYEEQVKNAIESFIGGLEPALTLLLGGLLAWVMLAVLGPVYSNLNLLGAAP